MKRYNIVMFENDWMRQESPTGEYVRFEDATVEIELLTKSRDSFREACHRYSNGPHLEIRMPDGELDEIVGYGGFHVEQMGDDHWFFMLGPCGFHLHGKRVRLVPLNHDTWAEAKEDLTTKYSAEMSAVEIGEYMLRHGRLPGEDDESEQDSHNPWCKMIQNPGVYGALCDCRSAPEKNS